MSTSLPSDFYSTVLDTESLNTVVDVIAVVAAAAAAAAAAYGLRKSLSGKFESPST